MGKSERTIEEEMRLLLESLRTAIEDEGFAGEHRLASQCYWMRAIDDVLAMGGET